MIGEICVGINGGLSSRSPCAIGLDCMLAVLAVTHVLLLFVYSLCLVPVLCGHCLPGCKWIRLHALHVIALCQGHVRP